MQSIGRYEVIRSLGRGGMGEVYLAHDPKLERQVAIKLLGRDDGDARALFEREAKVLAALNHPNIVTVFEIAELEDGRQLIAMEYLPGRSLRELLQQARPPRDDLVAICGQVAVALAAAHEAGILHRDIKPENVVVGKALGVKVVDFGIARRLDTPSLDPETARKPRDVTGRVATIVDVFTRTLPVDPAGVGALPSVRASAEDLGATRETPPPTLTGMTRTVFGTPAYMAPEVLMGEPSSTASDVYSLGVMLYECLTGRRPYEAPQLHELIARVIDGTDGPTRLDDPLAELIERMISRDPTARPPLVEIAKALARKRSQVAVTAPPAPARSRLIVPALAAIGVAGAIAAVAIWKTRDAEPPKEVAVEVAVPRRSVAIRPFDRVELPSYGTPPDTRALADVLAMVVESANVVSSLDIPDARRSGDADGALRVGGRLIEHGGVVTATFDVEDVATKQHTPLEVTGKPDEIAELLRRSADRIAGLAAPGSHVSNSRTLVDKLAAAGNKALQEHASSAARIYLEQAVLADDRNSELWARYATALEFIAAKRDAILHAADRAYETAPEGPRKQILRGIALIYRGHYPQALELLAPLEAQLASLPAGDRRDLLFQIGECHWHEGRHDEGFAYFRRTLELDPSFAEAASHAGEYALTRRNEPLAREYIRMQRMNVAWADFAMGRYEKLVDSDVAEFAAWSRMVLGRPPRPPKVPLAPGDALMEDISQAAAKGDLATVERGVTTLVGDLEPFTTYTAAKLISVGEIVVAAELPVQSRQILDALRTHQPTYHYKRLSILAAPFLGAPKFPRDQLTERLATLQTAIEAELANDRPTAVELLDALVKNPTYEWDFVERLALRRNLLALGRTKQAAALCADTLRPTMVRRVYPLARARCLGK